MRSSSRSNEWTSLWHDLRRRLTEPYKQSVNFSGYIFFAVIVFGGIGIWIELIRYMASADRAQEFPLVTVAVLAYFPSIAFSSFAQILLDDTLQHFYKGYAFLIGGVFVLCTIPISMNLRAPFALASAAALSLLAIWLVWGVANADSDLFSRGSVDDAAGGNPEKTIFDEDNGLNGYQS